MESALLSHARKHMSKYVKRFLSHCYEPADWVKHHNKDVTIVIIPKDCVIQLNQDSYSFIDISFRIDYELYEFYHKDKTVYVSTDFQYIPVYFLDHVTHELNKQVKVDIKHHYFYMSYFRKAFKKGKFRYLFKKYKRVSIRLDDRLKREELKRIKRTVSLMATPKTLWQCIKYWFTGKY